MAPFADERLAARLEGLTAKEMRRFVDTAREFDPESGAESLEVAGGVAAFVATGSPVNQAFGLGFAGEVTDADVAAVEAFFTCRATRPLVGVSPLAHPSLTETLGRRGWTVDGYENVLVRECGEAPVAPPTDSGVRITEALTAEERDTWALVAATGFSAPLPPLAEQLALAAIVVRRPGTRLFLAWLGDAVAGTGELYVEEGVAWLSADSTLERFRGRGIQQALQHHRLSLAEQAGCSLAVSEAEPGSTSQRNMERAGFSLAYTRVDFALVPGEGADAQWRGEA